MIFEKKKSLNFHREKYINIYLRRFTQAYRTLPSPLITSQTYCKRRKTQLQFHIKWNTFTHVAAEILNNTRQKLGL